MRRNPKFNRCELNWDATVKLDDLVVEYEGLEESPDARRLFDDTGLATTTPLYFLAHHHLLQIEPSGLKNYMCCVSQCNSNSHLNCRKPPVRPKM